MKTPDTDKLVQALLDNEARHTMPDEERERVTREAKELWEAAQKHVPKYPVRRLEVQLIDLPAEPVFQQVPGLGTKLADLESRGLEIPNVRLVSVTYPPSMAVEEAHTVPSHDWTTWLTGPPSDVSYEWCRACGTLKSMMHGEPTEYHVPGSQVSVALEPPCKGAKP